MGGDQSNPAVATREAKGEAYFERGAASPVTLPGEDTMAHYFSIEHLQTVWLNVRNWLLDNVLVLGNLIQLLAVLLAFALARWLGSRAVAWLLARRPKQAGLRLAQQVIASLALPIVWLLLQWLSILVASAAGWPHLLLRIVASLLTAWLVIHIASILIGETVWTRLVTWVAWTIAAFNILGLLDPTIAALKSAAFEIGELRISVYDVLTTTIALALLLWAAAYVARMIETRVGSSKALSPSLKVLINKLMKIVLMGLAIIIAVQMVGIDLTALTVFSGAVGLGIGFGLQRVISNLVCGVILLVDRSIKPGDVIAIENTYGWVNTLGGRYVSVITRDGTEHLIPNETLITNPVENWTHTNSLVRLKIDVGISYRSDVHRAIELCVEAASEVERVLALPEPRCLLIAFGESSIDLQIRIWVADPANGITNVRSEVMLKVWDKFKAHGIEIPFPQRDLHLRSSEVPFASARE